VSPRTRYTWRVFLQLDGSTEDPLEVEVSNYWSPKAENVVDWIKNATQATLSWQHKARYIAISAEQVL
jgi:hypothetical protein